jgi:hypothetical protein
MLDAEKERGPGGGSPEICELDSETGDVTPPAGTTTITTNDLILQHTASENSLEAVMADAVDPACAVRVRTPPPPRLTGPTRAHAKRA